MRITIIIAAILLMAYSAFATDVFVLCRPGQQKCVAKNLPSVPATDCDYGVVYSASANAFGCLATPTATATPTPTPTATNTATPTATPT